MAICAICIAPFALQFAVCHLPVYPFADTESHLHTESRSYRSYQVFGYAVMRFLTAYIKSYTVFRLPPIAPNCMSLTNYVFMYFTNFCNAFPVRCRVGRHNNRHLLTYFHSWLWAYETGNISETIEVKRKHGESYY